MSTGRWGPKLGGLRQLETIEPQGLSQVATTPGWEAVSFAVDSGASETVIPEDTVHGCSVQPSIASKRGVQYEIANSHRIPNLGQKTFVGYTKEGNCRGLTAQVCDVNKPLMSVSKLVAAGHTVSFAPSGSYVTNDSTGESIELVERNGMYMLNLWVPASSSSMSTGF